MKYLIDAQLKIRVNNFSNESVVAPIQNSEFCLAFHAIESLWNDKVSSDADVIEWYY